MPLAIYLRVKIRRNLARNGCLKILRRSSIKFKRDISSRWIVGRLLFRINANIVLRSRKARCSRGRDWKTRRHECALEKLGTRSRFARISWKLGWLVVSGSRVFGEPTVLSVHYPATSRGERATWLRRRYTHIVAHTCIRRYGFSYLIALVLHCVDGSYSASLARRETGPTMRERKLYSFHYIFYSDNPVSGPPADP